MDMLESLLQPEIRTGGTVGLSMLAMLFSFVLSLLITVVYRRTFSGERYSQAFVHTIIMMSVIVSIVMNVVSDNAGVAFGLFAVFSLIRFRSEVTDAKDISYIFFGLCVGMTAGLYRFDLAIVLTVFACAAFYLLHRTGYARGKHMQILKVTVPETMNHEGLLDGILDEFTVSHELRQVETTDLGTMILYTYAIQGKPDTADRDLLDRVREKNANLKVSLTYLGR
ncbi:DUF4956 domain-containing protein [Edaphobacillus lindanitolerans]|uniref:DUF4956 domain-containing protein n=1 Tax=Edaphobacillus lindanitolerans TaxID=550447 RepID=A0A1U7PTD0_9BACI|nr:DUF4956 domain-containing protein [Edaphobacillus lindanitolerans]SIT91938.1 protein of unknown function [Edaphobacillus lindanitolerans]